MDMMHVCIFHTELSDMTPYQLKSIFKYTTTKKVRYRGKDENVETLFSFFFFWVKSRGLLGLNTIQTSY